jgi:hypothetical protein
VTIGGWNNKLINVDGLAALTSIGYNLDIYGNGALMRCRGLYLLLTPGTIAGAVAIKENKVGCNSVAEIIDAGSCLEMEAEDAQVIGGDFQIGSDPNASGGQYV